MSGATRPASDVRAFVARLHFYIGLFVGPFLLIAAVTGLLYVLTPQIEEALYRQTLRTDTTGPARSLADQVEAARAVAGRDASLFAIRPAPAPGTTTRVMFSEPQLGGSEHRAIFIDPVTLAVHNDLVVYGTSGTLPFRTTLDYLHRNLLLGEFGRLYSELAASWLWVLTLGGILLWLWRRTGRLSRQNPKNGRLRTRRWHGLIGVTVSLGLLFLSATGLTWSEWAGGRIDQLRAALGWVTPSVSVALGATAPAIPGGHEHHDAQTPSASAPPAAETQLDAVLAAARAGGIDASMVEIRLPRPGRAWLIREYDRSWPTQVDTVALDPRDLAVTSRADFETFPLVAKLIRWGIDLHMGILFGVANQVAVALVALGLMATILYGYRVWWQNRPAPGTLPKTLVQGWLRLSWTSRTVAVLVGVGLAWALPVLGGSLMVFVLIDVLRWQVSKPAPQQLPAE